MGAGMRLSIIFVLILLNLYTFPVDKGVGVVAKKSKKANDHGQVGRRLQGSKHPQPDKNDIVCRIRNGVVTAAQKQKGSGKKAGGYRKGAEP